MGLEAYYATVRSSLLGIKQLSNLTYVYSRLVQEEEVRSMTLGCGDGIALMSFVVSVSASQGRGARGAARSGLPLLCTYCNRTGHLEDCCYTKHGYPEGWVDRQRGAGRGRGGNREYGTTSQN